MTPALAELFDKHVAATYDKQLFLFDLVKDRPWALDTETGLLSFGDEFKWQAQILGTQSDVSKTWLWAWANQASKTPENLMKSAAELRKLGSAWNIPEFTTPQFGITKAFDGHDLSIIATGVCNARAYYRGPYPGGAIFMLIDDPEFPPNIVDPAPRMATTFINVVKNHRCNHRRALIGYAEHFGLEVRPDGQKMCVFSNDVLILSTEFDEKGRVIQLEHKNPPKE